MRAATLTLMLLALTGGAVASGGAAVPGGASPAAVLRSGGGQVLARLLLSCPAPVAEAGWSAAQLDGTDAPGGPQLRAELAAGAPRAVQSVPALAASRARQQAAELRAQRPVRGP